MHLVADRRCQMKADHYPFVLRQGVLCYPLLVLRNGQEDIQILVGARSVSFPNRPDQY